MSPLAETIKIENQNRIQPGFYGDLVPTLTINRSWIQTYATDVDVDQLILNENFPCYLSAKFICFKVQNLSYYIMTNMVSFLY